MLCRNKQGSLHVSLLWQDCFELGVILLRKKLYTQATKNLDRAKRNWEGSPEDLAQVHCLHLWPSL